MEHLVEILKNVNSTPELFEETAKTFKNAFEALKKVGFTEEQAFQLVLQHGWGKH